MHIGPCAEPGTNRGRPGAGGVGTGRDGTRREPARRGGHVAKAARAERAVAHRVINTAFQTRAKMAAMRVRRRLWRTGGYYCAQAAPDDSAINKGRISSS